MTAASMDRPYSVFDAVSRHDHEGLVEEYIKNARNTIFSFLSMRKRWGRGRTELKGASTKKKKTHC